MPSETILLSEHGGVARLLLNKPRRLNALDSQMLTTIEDSVSRWEESAEVAVLVVGSTQERAFCAGADLEALAAMNEKRMQEWEMLGNRVLDRLQNSSLITIAALSGYILGGGLTLAAACDIRIAAENAIFAQPEIELGWIPGWGGVGRLARLVGASRAKELSMTGRRLNATQAQPIGLVDEIVPSAQLQSRVSELATVLTQRSRQALQAIKDLADSLVPAADRKAHRFDALQNASLLNDPRGQAEIARFLARKAAREQ